MQGRSCSQQVLELLRFPSSNQVGPANGLASLRSGTWKLELLGEYLTRIGLVCLFGLHCKVAGSPHCSNQTELVVAGLVTIAGVAKFWGGKP